MAESAWVIRESGLETGPNKRERGESQREAPNEFQDSTGRQGRERERSYALFLGCTYAQTCVKLRFFPYLVFGEFPFLSGGENLDQETATCE